VVAGLLAEGSSHAGKTNVLQETGIAFSQIAKEALPAVVFIDVETTGEVPQRRYSHLHAHRRIHGYRFFRSDQSSRPHQGSAHQAWQAFARSVLGIYEALAEVGDSGKVLFLVTAGRGFRFVVVTVG